MLNAFQNHLSYLVAEESGAFRERVRERLGKRATPAVQQKLVNFVAMTPKVIHRLYRRANDHPGEAKVKGLGGFALSYLYNPKDFLPEKEFGLFGYIDDAYVVARSFQLMLYELSAVGVKLTEWEESFLQDLDTIQKNLAILIPIEKVQIEKMIDEILSNKHDEFNTAFI